MTQDNPEARKPSKIAEEILEHLNHIRKAVIDTDQIINEAQIAARDIWAEMASIKESLSKLKKEDKDE